MLSAKAKITKKVDLWGGLHIYIYMVYVDTYVPCLFRAICSELQEVMIMEEKHWFVLRG